MSELARQCRYCTGPNTALSTGGPDVCVMCEVHGVEPAVWMGRCAPYDFHAHRRETIGTDFAASRVEAIKNGDT